MEQKRKLENKGPEKTDDLSTGSPFFKLDPDPESSPVHPVLQLQSLIGNEATTALIQTKLQVSKPGDIYEQEADRVAEEVMRMAEPPVQVASDEANAHDLIRAKVETSPTSEVGTDLEARIRSSEARGQPLAASIRSFFEPRFGADFSNVRVHTDSEADQLNRALHSRAFTTGHHIFLRQNEYEPSDPKCKELLAHEMTHVLQQERPIKSQGEMHVNTSRSSQMAIVQRKIKTKNVPIDEYLKKQGIAGYKYDQLESVYSHLGLCIGERKQEIIYNMLYSGRIFKVDGVTSNEATKNIDEHVKARLGVVDQTLVMEQRKIKFAAGSNVKMNPEYWQEYTEGNKEPRMGAKPGVSVVKAAQDVFKENDPYPYAIGCELAAGINMLAGSGSEKSGYKDQVEPDDWVPGDWGAIVNTGYIKGKSRDGTEGENIIYCGGAQYWGFPQGEMTLNNWIDFVHKWDNAMVQVNNWRLWTGVGLEEEAE